MKEFRPGPGERGPVLKLYRISETPAEASSAVRAGPDAAAQPRWSSSPGASPAAASTSPSAIGRRPGRTIA